MLLSQSRYPRVISMRPFIVKQLDSALGVRNGVANSDILRSYLGLLVQGKSDFDAIENFRGDTFFKHALGIKLLPSSPTLRQRMDARAEDLFDFLPPLIETLLAGARPDYGVLPCGWLPLDVDTFAMDNGGTAKDGVGRTWLLPAGRVPWLARVLPGVGAAPGRAALGVGDAVQLRARDPDGAAPERGGPEGADPGATGLRLRLRGADARDGLVQRQQCRRAGDASGGLADQMESAHDQRGGAGRAP